MPVNQNNALNQNNAANQNSPVNRSSAVNQSSPVNRSSPANRNSAANRNSSATHRSPQQSTAARFAERRARAGAAPHTAGSAQDSPELAPVEFVEPRGAKRSGKPQSADRQQADHSPETMRLLRDPFAA